LLTMIRIPTLWQSSLINRKILLTTTSNNLKRNLMKQISKMKKLKTRENRTRISNSRMLRKVETLK